jgi:5'-nucleotidase
MKKTIFVDMDRVLCDFDKAMGTSDFGRNPSEMYDLGFFTKLEPLPGALVAMRKLAKKYDVHILTQPAKYSIACYSEKAAWIAQYLPEFLERLHMSQNKEFFMGDYLIDDNEKWATFTGEFILFDPTDSAKEWERICVRLL